MKIYFSLAFFFLTNLLYSNSPANVYLFPGQGSDERIFSDIKLDSCFTIIHIVYPIPEKDISLKEYAQLISQQIDTSKSYILIGVSLGGMICTEITDFLKPEKTIIISSAKSRNELPLHYRFQKFIPLNKIIPKKLIKLGALLLQPMVEPDRNKNKATFKNMLKGKDPAYLKRTVNMIINWDREKCNSGIIHIHGSKDHTLPAKNIKAGFIIKNGSHMMVLTKGKEINDLIVSILRT